jgi:Cation efflux family
MATLPIGRRRKSSSRTSVVAALIGNLLVAASKIVAAAWTGSAAMTSEAVHSVVDTTNEMLLLYGIHRSKRKADLDHPFGHALRREASSDRADESQGFSSRRSAGVSARAAAASDTDQAASRLAIERINSCKLDGDFCSIPRSLTPISGADSFCSVPTS